MRTEILRRVPTYDCQILIDRPVTEVLDRLDNAVLQASPPERSFWPRIGDELIGSRSGDVLTVRPNTSFLGGNVAPSIRLRVAAETSGSTSVLVRVRYPLLVFVVYVVMVGIIWASVLSPRGEVRELISTAAGTLWMALILFGLQWFEGKRGIRLIEEALAVRRA